jgi:hypothetical protein
MSKCGFEHWISGRAPVLSSNPKVPERGREREKERERQGRGLK